MSQEKDTTHQVGRAIPDIAALNGKRPAAEVFQDLAADYRAGNNTWREVSPQFARYCTEAIPPIHGPDGSRSFALGECFEVTRHGAVHCVIAQEGGRHFAKHVNLMRWAEELLDLRDALSGLPLPDACAMDCEACKRKICTGATQIARVGEEGGGQ